EKLLEKATRICTAMTDRSAEQSRTADAAVHRREIHALVGSPHKLDSAFATPGIERRGAGLVPPDTTPFFTPRHIAQLAATTRLPAIYGYREHVEDGGLMSYGPDIHRPIPSRGNLCG